ncbi:hypothetical protein [Sphingomonas morindae]|uniref:Uncharacterized protein n=1 Tax=Sphingomonas morindae TaxID=1541170 RepID=A0ABY4XAW8_9SPHN|nr:hypothetical protein [Sphingomonas morindae]USI74097.1 hypothetical protein LHA26_06445 [Sphingomonas morindae]
MVRTAALYRFWRDTRGAAPVDYALALGLVAIGRSLAMAHGEALAALLKPLLPG